MKASQYGPMAPSGSGQNLVGAGAQRYTQCQKIPARSGCRRQTILWAFVRLRRCLELGCKVLAQRMRFHDLHRLPEAEQPPTQLRG